MEYVWAFLWKKGAPTTKQFPQPAANLFTYAPTPVNTTNPDPIYPNLDYLHRVAYNVTYALQGDTTTASNVSRYRAGDILPAPPTPPIAYSQKDLTLEQNFNPILRKWVYVDAPTDYEKVGVRSQLNFDFGFGLGVAVKGGVVDVKQKFSHFNLETQLLVDAGIITPAPSPLAIGNVTEQADAKNLYNQFFIKQRLEAAAKELGQNWTTYHKTTGEDLHMELYWHFPIKLEDRDGDVGVTFIPCIAVGGWFPIAEEVSQKNPFAVPTGNDGFYGFTADLSFGFDFPVLPNTEHQDRTLQWNFGGGVLVLNEKDQKNVRFPCAGSPAVANPGPQLGDPTFSTVYQSGLIPWQTNIRRRPGVTWYFETSLKAEDFLEGLSAYIDFTYTQHLHDKVTIKETETTTRLPAFTRGKHLFQSWTAWKNQQIDFGLDYRIVDALTIGGAVQAHISGVRVYRCTTLLGSLQLKF